MEGICVSFLDPVHFFPITKGRCHGNQFCVVSKTQTTCDFCNFYTIWKRFRCRWQIWSSFFNILRDVAIATNLVAKMGQNYLTPAFIALSMENGMGYRYPNGRVNSENDAFISCKNFVNFGPVTQERKRGSFVYFFCNMAKNWHI